MVKLYTISSLLLAATLSASAQFQAAPRDAALPRVTTLPSAAPAASSGEVEFSYFTGSDSQLGGLGTSQVESYEVAIHLNNPDLVGATLSAISFYQKYTANQTDFSVWVATSLTTDGSAVVARATANVNSTGRFKVALDKPFTIPAGGCYVGYSFTVNANALQNDNYPVQISNAENTAGGLYLRTSKSVTAWMDGAADYGVSSIKAYLTNTNLPELAVSIADVKDAYVDARAQEGSTTLTLVNRGTTAISSIEYLTDVNGEEGVPTSVSVNLPAVPLGATASIKINFSLYGEGSYPLRVAITRVNGKTNLYEEDYASATVYGLPFLPKHRAVVEEYTGTWCQYCPRGFVGMNKMRRLFGDDFVGICYHYDGSYNYDPMQVTTSFPSNVPGFPDAWLDRVEEVDAYHGTLPTYDFGLDQAWLQRCEETAPADVNAEANWNADSTAITVTASVNFAISAENSNYRLAYVLLADSLHGTTRGWGQYNAFRNNSYYAGDPDMSVFVNGASTVNGLYFNDVLIAFSNLRGVAGSIPASIAVNQPITHTYTFSNIEGIKSSRGELLVQDKRQLHAAVLLIDYSTGAIVNANNAKIWAEGITGIEQVADSHPSSNAAFDLQGRRLPQEAKGLQIRGGRIILVK